MTIEPPSTSSPQGSIPVKEQSVDEQQVRRLFGAGEGVSTGTLASDVFSHRHNWGDTNGEWILSLEWGAIKNSSRVFVAMSEAREEGGKVIGDARCTVHNVAPRDGQIRVWVNVELDSPIKLLVDYLVFNP